MIRLDLIEANVDGLTRLSQACHQYGLLPTSYSPLTRQQLLQVIAVSLGFHTYEDLKKNVTEQHVSNSITTREKIQDFYLRNNRNIKLDDLERCVHLISHLTSSVMFLRATYRSFFPPTHMRLIKDLKLPKANPNILKKKQYSRILDSIYKHAIDDTNWPRILILPLAHTYLSKVDGNDLVNIDIADCFNKQLNKEKIQLFHTIWMENINDFLPTDEQLFIADDMNSFKQDISTFTQFTATANPLLTKKEIA